MDKKKLNSDTGTDILIIKPIKKRSFFKKLKQKAKRLLVSPDRNSILIAKPIKKRSFFKKLKQKAKRLLVSVDLILVLQSTINTHQAIGLPVLPSTYISTIKQSQPEFSQFSKKVMIGQLLEAREDKVILTKKEVDLYFDLAMQVKNGTLSQEELITQLRGGADINDILLALSVILGLVALLNGWTPPIPTPYPMPVPPNQHPLYKNNPGQRNFGGNYKSDSSSYKTQQGATQSANSELNDSLSPSYDYYNVMDDIKGQLKLNKRKIVVQVGEKIYEINNQNLQNSLSELEIILEKKVYEDIRLSSTDIDSITGNVNLGYKKRSVQALKDHIFIKCHRLDKYDDIEYKPFDPNLQQGMAWLRAEKGIDIPEDREWMMHEFYESIYEIRHDCGYSEAHGEAQSRYDEYPWKRYKYDKPL